MPATTTVIIPWRNRPELVHTLAQNANIFRAHNMGVLIVNCGGNDALLNQAIQKNDMPLTVVDLPADLFNRSLAINVGILHSTSDYLFVLDADVVLDADGVEACRSCLEKGHVVTLERLRESVGQEPSSIPCSERLRDVVLTHRMEVRWSDGTSSDVESYREYLDGSHGGQGQLFVCRRHLVEIDGYNSHLLYWGFEDVDVLIRLQRSLGLRHGSAGEATHLSHGDEVRELGGTKRWESNRRNAALACANYDRGILSGTLTEDAAVWSGRSTKRVSGIRASANESKTMNAGERPIRR